MIHKFSGYLVFMYGFIHSIIHLSVTFPALESKSYEEVDACIDHISNNDYQTFLFGTLTGFSGLLLLISISAMAITSPA